LNRKFDSAVVIADSPWIAQRPWFFTSDRLRQCKGVTAKHVDIVEAQRGQAGDVFITNVVSAGVELVQRRIHINRVPEHRPKLLDPFLPFLKRFCPSGSQCVVDDEGAFKVL
jgi:hypothetical protein